MRAELHADLKMRAFEITYLDREGIERRLSLDEDFYWE